MAYYDNFVNEKVEFYPKSDFQVKKKKKQDKNKIIFTTADNI